MADNRNFFDVPYEEHQFGASIDPQALGLAAPGGVGPIGTPDMVRAYAKLTRGKPATKEVREACARRILVSAGLPEFSASTAIYQWEHTAVYFDAIAALDNNTDEIADNLPSKAKIARDVYVLASTEGIAADDRLRAYRLYGELQGHITKGPNVAITNDNRSIILVPRRSPRGDDPDREEKVIQAQARLMSDARKP